MIVSVLTILIKLNNILTMNIFKTLLLLATMVQTPIVKAKKSTA